MARPENRALLKVAEDVVQCIRGPRKTDQMMTEED